MKIKDALKKAKEEIKEDNEKIAISIAKASLKNITDCKRTLRKLEKQHKKLLERDIEDIEENSLIYEE